MTKVLDALDRNDYLAFTNSPKGGNPASVVWGADGLSSAELQAVAREIAAPATTFVLPSSRASFRLRFFTPQVEEEVCGHATVAALHHLSSLGRLPEGPFMLETLAGLLSAEIRDGVAWLEYGSARAWEVEVSREAVALAAGLEPDDLHEDLPVLAATAGRAKLFAAVPSTTILDAAEPDLERIRALNLETGTTGLVLFTFPGRGGAFTDSRHFAPLAGILEDIATGNAHAALAAYLARTGFLDDGERSFSGAQGHALGRPSRLEVRTTVSGGEVTNVAVGGRAVEVSG